VCVCWVDMLCGAFKGAQRLLLLLLLLLLALKS